MSYHWIRASDIPDYVYCRRTWWLRRAQGATSQHEPQMVQGRQFHQAHSQLVLRAIWARRLAYALLFLLVTFITFQILMNTWR